MQIPTGMINVSTNVQVGTRVAWKKIFFDSLVAFYNNFFGEPKEWTIWSSQLTLTLNEGIMM